MVAPPRVRTTTAHLHRFTFVALVAPKVCDFAAGCAPVVCVATVATISELFLWSPFFLSQRTWGHFEKR
ncbi:hypothetical protein HN51_039969 [Arachis hypogaea]